MPLVPVSAGKRKGIAVAVTNDGRLVDLSWTYGLVLQSYPVGVSPRYLVAHETAGMGVAEARNRLCELALQHNHKYLWLVDDDTVPPADAARKLMYLLDQEEAKGSNVLIAGGVYCTKQDPPTPLVFKEMGDGPYWQWKVGDTFRCWGIGTGCMMINTRALDKIPRPWFKIKDETHSFFGEDLYFCEQAAKNGVGVMAHGGVLCTHIDTKAEPRCSYSLPPDSYPFLPAEGAGPTMVPCSL
jgi:GT2 family glycosyltransferase